MCQKLVAPNQPERWLWRGITVYRTSLESKARTADFLSKAPVFHVILKS